MAKRRRKRRLKIKNIIIFLIILLFFVGFIYYIITMPIKNIYIKGNNILSDNVILSESGLIDYPSFLLTSSKKTQKKIKTNYFVDNVKVKKKFGNIIEINVQEYKIVATIEEDDRIILSNGRIVENIYNIKDIPILTNSVSEEVYNDFVKKFGDIDNSILRQISQIEYSPVKVDNSRFLLYMDDGNLVYVTLTKIKKMNKYNDIKDKMSNKKGIIYLDSGDYVELKD